MLCKAIENKLKTVYRLEVVDKEPIKFEKIEDSRLQNIKGVTAEEFDHQIGNNNQLIWIHEPVNKNSNLLN